MIKALFFLVWFVFHPVHVTLTSIDYIPESDSLKVFVKMYVDDFLLDMSFHGDTASVAHFTEGDPLSKDILENYINNNLLLRVNKKLIAGKLNNFDIVNNEVKIYISYKQVRDPETISVQNLIMTDLYADQSNLVIIKIKEFEEGIKLTSGITEKSLRIK